MNYPAWELERQRAALETLLLGGGRETDEIPQGTAGGAGSSPGGTRRSPAGPEGARVGALREAGRYAGGETGTRVPGSGAPEAGAEGRAAGPPLPKGAGLGPPEWGGERAPAGAVFAGDGGSAETSDSTAPRRYTPEEARTPPWEGTGPRAAFQSPSEAAAREAAEAAGRNRAGAGSGGGLPFAGDGGGPFPGAGAGGGEDAAGRETADTAPGEPRGILPENGGGAGRPGPGERLSRSLPWGGGWESPALLAEDGARALSRAVQRDARRYDGGFTIY